MKLKYIRMVLCLALCGTMMIGCDKGKDNPTQGDDGTDTPTTEEPVFVNFLPGTNWEGSLKDTITVSGREYILDCTASCSFLDTAAAYFKLHITSGGSPVGADSTNIRYTFDGREGTMIDGTEIVPFTYDSVSDLLTVKEFYVGVSGQQVGGNYVMHRIRTDK